MKKISLNKEIIFLILLGLVARVFVSYFYADEQLRNEWNMILHNYEVSGVLGFNVVINENLALPKLAETGEKVLPTAFMPPLYLYLIFVIKFLLNDTSNLTKIIIFIQIILSLASAFIFYKILEKLIKKKINNLILSSIFIFFPLNVYASSQISSVTLQIFLITGFLYFLFLFKEYKKSKDLVIFSFFSGLLILIRGEFLFFYIFSSIYFFIYIYRNIKTLLISFIITSIVIIPYLNRNYQNFDTFVLTKSFGYNLLKGNNPSFKVEGDYKHIEEIKKSENKNIKSDNYYEINLDNLFKKKAISFILEDPFSYIKFYFIKVISFLFIDFNSTYPYYYNIFHLLPKILLALTSFVGAVLAINKKGFFQFLSLYFFLNIFLFSIFFILPRYSLILLPIQLLLVIEFAKYLKRKLIN